MKSDLHSGTKKCSRCAQIIAGLSLCLSLASSGGAELENSTNQLEKLMSLKLEDILRTEVTSVSKRPEKLFESPAAVFSISAEDIRRSGATSIPEALRLAPGISVAQIDANKWAVTSRGFNSRFADKLLVLVDGRSVYTPTFSGVYWSDVDYLLEDIERIEVIRGPGGTLWGANAVNGVINIITKSARDTEGVYATGGAGTTERGFFGARYGTKLGENGSLRGYLKYKNVDDFEGGHDAWDSWQGGFRSDWSVGQNDITFQGDYFYGNHKQLQVVPQYFPVPGTVPPSFIDTLDEHFHSQGGNMLFRFERQLSSESGLQLQAYYDHTERDDLVLSGWRDTFDVDFQHRFALPLRQNLIWGLGYRYLPDHFRNPEPLFITWEPDDRHWQLFSGFIQDEITLVEDHLRLTLGTKVEHNDFTGWEVEPSGRLLWLITPRQTAWAAVSRAVQVPGRNLDGIMPILLPIEPTPVPVGPPFGTLPLFVTGQGNRDLDATEVISYELGYRIQATDQISFDVAGFYSDYSDIVDGGLSDPTFNAVPVPHLDLRSTAIGGKEGSSYGVEIAAQWVVTDWWRLQGTYAYFKSDLDELSNSLFAEGKDPQQQVSLRSSMDLPGHLTLDLWGRWVDRLPSYVAEGVTAYFDLDVRLGWQPHKNWELAVVGQNLIDPDRREFGEDPFTKTDTSAVPRGVYVQATFRY
jgi:iron complex outermembrane receptor protein